MIEAIKERIKTNKYSIAVLLLIGMLNFGSVTNNPYTLILGARLTNTLFVLAMTWLLMKSFYRRSHFLNLGTSLLDKNIYVQGLIVTLVSSVFIFFIFKYKVTGSLQDGIEGPLLLVWPIFHALLIARTSNWRNKKVYLNLLRLILVCLLCIIILVPYFLFWGIAYSKNPELGSIFSFQFTQLLLKSMIPIYIILFVPPFPLARR